MKDTLAVVSKSKTANTNIQKLIAYERRGFVFHGSPNGEIKTLEPRQAKDAKQKEGFNVDMAVFAAPSPIASTLFACMSRDSIPTDIRNGTWSVGSDKRGIITARIPVKWKPYITENTGFVYVLSGDPFVGEGEGSWQVKSKVAVEPVEIIEVTFSDFERLGGKIVWKEDD